MRNRTILTIIVMLFVVNYKCNAQTTKIDFDYSKLFDVEHIFLDYNGNQEADLDNGEIIATDEKTKITLGLVYKDFGSAGNILNIEIKFENKDTKKGFSIKGNFEDIDFGHVKDNDSISYLVHNKLGEVEFAVLVQNKRTTVAIFNVSRMKILDN